MSGHKTFRLLIADDEAAVLSAYEASLAELAPSAAPKSRALEDELFGETPKAENGQAPSGDIWALEIETVSSGDDAVAAVRRANAEGRPFAVAFLDVRMPPGIDGVEAAARIRELDGDINIVIVTAYADTSLKNIVARVRPVEKLFYLAKPFHPLEIQQFAHALAQKWSAERALRVAHRLLEANVDNAVRAFHDADTARERAEHANVAKSSIIARAGVDLRSPLNALVGFSKLIADQAQGIENKQYVEYASLIHQAAAEVVKKVETVIETARYDRNDVELETDRINISHVLETLDRDFRKQARDKRVAFKLETPALDRQILADILRLRQALGHIIVNAFEACPSGGEIRLRVADEAGGVALSIEYPHSEFDPLAKAAARDGAQSGDAWVPLSGQSAGLFISQRILELHGAGVMVCSGKDATTVRIAFALRDAA